MRRLTIAIMLGLALILPATVSAAKPVEYTIALDGIASGVASFTVTRSVNGDPDNVAWVHVDCSISDPAIADETTVKWGLWSSYVGHASLSVAGHCTAYVTYTPWRVKHNDVSISFDA